MARTKIAALMAVLAMSLVTSVEAQFQNPQAERPIINGFRQRATNNLFTDAAKRWSQNSPLSGKLCPKCATKRNERFKESAEDKQILRDSQKASLDKLTEEAKLAKFQAKAAEEADFEKHKPWDVAAPENLESPSPLLQAAAKTKQDQDLAPKKIRALEYLAQLGCSKSEEVEKAILAGLKDANPAVRWAAIQAVLTSARGAQPATDHPFVNNIVPAQPENSMVDPLKYGLEEEDYPADKLTKKDDEKDGEAAEEPPACEKCENCRKRKPCLQRLKGLCKRCKGHGCRTCNFGGHSMEACQQCPPIVEMPCEPCQECVACNIHDGCKTCCPSPAILAELKKIATAKDEKRPGCFFEPSIDLRNLALEALNVCPPLPDKKPPRKDPNLDEVGGSGNGDSKVDENKGDTSTEDEPQLNSPSDQDNNVSSFMPISHRRNTMQYASEDQSELLMNARIAKFYQKGFLVEFEGDYLIPTGKQLLIQLTDGRTYIANVVKSETGFAQVIPEGDQLFDIPSTRLSIGVIE